MDDLENMPNGEGTKIAALSDHLVRHAGRGAIMGLIGGFVAGLVFPVFILATILMGTMMGVVAMLFVAVINRPKVALEKPGDALGIEDSESLPDQLASQDTKMQLLRNIAEPRKPEKN